MNHAELRARLATPFPIPPPRRTRILDVPPPSPAVQAVPAGTPAALGMAEGPLIPAAVLVAFVTGKQPGVLLTRRTSHLNRHAGQIAFPGGRIDPGDVDAEAAALREAQEEIGLDPGKVELSGRLGDYIVGTGYRMTPVMGLLPEATGLEDLSLTLSPHEVDAIFVLPFSVLLDPAAPELRRAEVRGQLREFWVWPHPEHHIWGATAAVLVEVAARLRGTRQGYGE